MPAKKATSRAVFRAAANRPHRTTARTMVTRARTALQGSDIEAAEVAVREAEKALDHAATKGVLHSNNASRRKGRLWQALNKLRSS